MPKFAGGTLPRESKHRPAISVEADDANTNGAKRTRTFCLTSHEQNLKICCSACRQERKMNHSKGRTKVAARQRLPSIGEYASVELSDDNSEVGEVQSVSVVPQLDTVIKRSAAAKRKKRSRKNDLNADSDHSNGLGRH
ncbi:unnamed protein product [Peronospora farinosa]|uniref:Uncharacterized protein n=1 Tax=Peronospora farinosa TaxID=134698 RepID=A0ABN8CD73_9STRA|nr:unnamed protein product [Peronospora farinosa]